MRNTTHPGFFPDGEKFPVCLKTFHKMYNYGKLAVRTFSFYSRHQWCLLFYNPGGDDYIENTQKPTNWSDYDEEFSGYQPTKSYCVQHCLPDLSSS